MGGYRRESGWYCSTRNHQPTMRIVAESTRTYQPSASDAPRSRTLRAALRSMDGVSNEGLRLVTAGYRSTPTRSGKGLPRRR